jgi:hypothetical protein
MNPGPCLKLSPVRDTPGVLGTEGVPYTRENRQQPLGHINHRCGQVTITWCLVGPGTTGGKRNAQHHLRHPRWQLSERKECGRGCGLRVGPPILMT